LRETEDSDVLSIVIYGERNSKFEKKLDEFVGKLDKKGLQLLISKTIKIDGKICEEILKHLNTDPHFG